MDTIQMEPIECMQWRVGLHSCNHCVRVRRAGGAAACGGCGVARDMDTIQMEPIECMQWRVGLHSCNHCVRVRRAGGAAACGGCGVARDMDTIQMEPIECMQWRVGLHSCNHCVRVRRAGGAAACGGCGVARDMDTIQMEPIGKYKADRNGSAKGGAWRNMVEQDLDDVAFLAESDKAREARELRDGAVAVCSQRRALCLAALVFSAIFAAALLVAYAGPQPDCPCAGDNMLVPGSPPPDSAAGGAAANKERIASNGQPFPWRGARLPVYIIPKHYNLWLHPNLTTGDLKGEVSIDFKVDRDTSFLVVNARDTNVTEKALFKAGGGATGPKILKTLEFLPADQFYIEFKDKLRRRYNYTLSLRFTTRLERSERMRGFFLAGDHRNRAAVSRFWLTHARSAFPCFDEPHFKATFRLTIVRDRFHVSLTNMPIVATEEAGFYLGHRLLQDEFAVSPPMSPHMVALTVCALQRRAAPRPATPSPRPAALAAPAASAAPSASTAPADEPPPPEISLYSDQQSILDDSEPLLEWVAKTLQQFAFELNTSYPLPKLDLVVVEGGAAYSEGWGLVTLSPATLADTKVIARLLAQQWFGGLISPRWWSAQWLMEALTSVLGEKAPPYGDVRAPRRRDDALLLEHTLPALRLDSSNSVRAVASQRLERADIESATDELSLHKGAALVSMAVRAAGAEAGRAALARLLRDHRAASADARDLWRALHQPPGTPPHTWETWAEQPGYPLLTARRRGSAVVLHQERFVMAAEPPDPERLMTTDLLTQGLRYDLEQLIMEPDNITETEEDVNATTTAAPPTTTTRRPKPTKPPPAPKWVIPLTFVVGPVAEEEEERVWVRNSTDTAHNGTWYDVGNETKTASRWTENVTHLIWMNETDMEVPDLGRHAWVRYNVGARGLYRVAPQDPTEGESAAARAHTEYASAGPAERALLLDNAFVLSRAGRLPASRALLAAACLRNESHWAPWRAALGHLSSWRALLRLSAAGPRLQRFLRSLHPELRLYTRRQLAAGDVDEDDLWLSGALLTSGVEWGNAGATSQALALFDAWHLKSEPIMEVYQEGAFTAGVRERGAPAWEACWRALLASSAAPRPTLAHEALLRALAAPPDDWLFYRFAWSALALEGARLRGAAWPAWAEALGGGACRWRDAAAAWRLLRARPAHALLAPLAACLRHATDYYQVQRLLGNETATAAASLDTIALNAAWAARAEDDLYRYFETTTDL